MLIMVKSAMGKVLETPVDNYRCVQVDENIWLEMLKMKNIRVLFIGHII